MTPEQIQKTVSTMSAPPPPTRGNIRLSVASGALAIGGGLHHWTGGWIDWALLAVGALNFYSAARDGLRRRRAFHDIAEATALIEAGHRSQYRVQR